MKCLSEKRISSPKNSGSLAGLLRYQVHKSTKTFQKLATFDFESICVPEDSFKDTKTTMWIGKHLPISESNFSSHVEEPIFFYNSDPQHLVSLFIGTMEGLASQSEAQKELSFLGIEAAIWLGWATTWRNSANVILDGNTRCLT